MCISQIDLIYKFNWTTCFGLADHLQVQLNLYIRSTCDIYIVVFYGLLLVIFILDTTVGKILDLRTFSSLHTWLVTQITQLITFYLANCSFYGWQFRVLFA
jgi:hypothetical protein